MQNSKNLGEPDRLAGASDVFVYVSVDDPLTQILLEDLRREYEERYGDQFPGGAVAELARYPASDFEAPSGAFVLLLHNNQVVAGGAFKRLTDDTVEFKRIWTHPEHRRKGYSRRILAELEAEARRLGYRRVYLTTGSRQPEAHGLYRATGFTALFDTKKTAEEIGVHAFEKELVPHRRRQLL